MTSVAVRPGMQPARMPSSVEPKASASDVGVRYPTTALREHHEAVEHQGSRTRKMYWKTSVTAIANAGATIAAVIEAADGRGAPARRRSRPAARCAETGSRWSAASKAGRCRAARRHRSGRGSRSAPRASSGIRSRQRGLGRRGSVGVLAKAGASAASRRTTRIRPKMTMPMPSSPGTTPGAVEGGIPSDCSRSIVHEP